MFCAVHNPYWILCLIVQDLCIVGDQMTKIWAHAMTWNNNLSKIKQNFDPTPHSVYWKFAFKYLSKFKTIDSKIFRTQIRGHRGDCSLKKGPKSCETASLSSIESLGNESYELEPVLKVELSVSNQNHGEVIKEIWHRIVNFVNLQNNNITLLWKK
jgi:hypothetical protein